MDFQEIELLGISLFKLACKSCPDPEKLHFFPFQEQNDSCAFENLTVSPFILALQKLSSL